MKYQSGMLVRQGIRTLLIQTAGPKNRISLNMYYVEGVWSYQSERNGNHIADLGVFPDPVELDSADVLGILAVCDEHTIEGVGRMAREWAAERGYL